MTEIAGVPGDGDELNESEIQAALSEDILRRFVLMVLFARQGMGAWDETSGLSSFYVALGDSDDDWLVRINDEPEYWTTPRAVRSIEPGDSMIPSDVMTSRVAAPETPPTRFISGRWTGTAWDLELRLNAPHPARDVHLDAGLEFAKDAERALERGHLRAFHEAAFHAVEHLAKAELLSYAVAVPEIAECRKHGRLRGTYQLWAHLGNTDDRFPRLLQELDSGRRSITYAEGEDRRDDVRAREQAALLCELAEWVQSITEDRVPKTIKLWTTQAIAAGELVSTESTSIRPSNG